MQLPSPYRVEIFDTLGSTHDEILSRARQGEPGFLWIMAREQTGGRGRLGRVWHSPKGNLYASLLLYDVAPLKSLAELGFVAGVALQQAASAVSGLDSIRLKWPNDLVVNGAKLSGMLMETMVTPHGRAVALGFGVNLVESPPGLEYATTSLYALSGKSVLPEDFLVALTQALAQWLEIWAQGQGFLKVRDAWLQRAANLNQTIKVRRHDDVLTGIFTGIDQSGCLLLRCEKESVTINAGDVFLV